MLLGIGTDIIEISRVGAVLERQGDKLLQRLLTPEEFNYWLQKGRKPATLAGFWAAKEAVAKALGTGIRFKFRDINIGRDSLGAPTVVLRGGAAEHARQRGVDRIYVSISHNRTQAVAFAAAEGGNAVAGL